METVFLRWWVAAFAAAVLASAYWWATVRVVRAKLAAATRELERRNELFALLRWWVGNAAESEADPRARYWLCELALLAIDADSVGSVLTLLRTAERTATGSRAAFLRDALAELTELRRPDGARWWPWEKWSAETGRPLHNPGAMSWWRATLFRGEWSAAALGVGAVPRFGAPTDRESNSAPVPPSGQIHE